MFDALKKFYVHEFINPKILPDPKVGETWESNRTPKNPFDTPAYVDIEDIKDGWVKYRYLGAFLSPFYSSFRNFKTLFIPYNYKE